MNWIIFRLTVAVVACVAIAACGDGPKASETPSVAPSATDTEATNSTPDPTAGAPMATPETPRPVPEGLHGQDVRTGEPSVDSFLQALEERDSAAATLRIVESEYACGTELGTPRCPEGQPAGTLISGVAMGGCSLQWFGRETAISVLVPIVAAGTYYPFAAYRQPTEVATPADQFIVIIATSMDGDVLRVTLDSDGHITGFHGQCGNPLRVEAPIPEGAEIILAPASP